MTECFVASQEQFCLYFVQINRSVILRRTSGTTRYQETLRGTKSDATRYYELLRGITGSTTSHYEVLRVVLQGITRGLRYYEWFFRGIARCQLQQLATTFLMDKIKVVFVMSSNSDIICFLVFLIREDEEILRSYLVMKINRRFIRNG